MDIRLNHIEQVFKNNLAELFHYNTFNDGKEYIEDLFIEISYICEEYIKQTNQFQNISHDMTNKFFKVMLPIFVEIFLRRKTDREHEITLSNFFTIIARLLAQPITHEFVELNELRNFLFQNVLSSNFKFITLKHIKLSNANSNNYMAIPMTSGFFHEFGKPSISISGNEITFFWPDEWMKVLGQEKAIGHFVCIYLNDESIWREGEVVEYDSTKDLYKIILDPIVENHNIKLNYSETQSKSKESETSEEVVWYDIKSSLHYWSDINNKSRIVTKFSKAKNSKTLLANSENDIGSYVRILVSYHQKSIYGKIVSYKNLRHGILYEDGDLREYDMRNLDYEVIDPLIYHEKISNNQSEVNNIRIVGKLFQSYKDSQITHIVPSPVPTETQQSNLIPRPDASQNSHLSYYYINMINVYIQEQGFSHFYYRLSDSSNNPLTCKILLLYVQFIYLLRHTLPNTLLKDVVWEVKEGITYALSRYTDLQFKELVQNDFYDLLSLVKELVIFIFTSNNTNQLTSNIKLINESIDMLRLTMSLKLLRCSLISKKYLGLSIIKEYIEILQPKLPAYTSKRLQYLSQTKNGRYIKPIENTNIPVFNQPRNLPSYQHALSTTMLTSQDLLVWLVKHKVIEEIFVYGSIHQDLAMKSDLILIFLSYKRFITESHLETIWQSCKGAHEAVVKVIHTLILLIIPVLDYNLRIKLFNYISNVPNKEYNESLLYFIKSYTVQTLIKNKEEKGQNADVSPNKDSTNNIATGLNIFEDSFTSITNDSSSTNPNQYNNINRKGLVVSAPSKQWLGFAVLWQFIQDPSVTSTYSTTSSFDSNDESLFDLAIQLLVELLQTEFIDERERVMSRCIEFIRLGFSVPGSLQLLRRTLGTYPSSIKSWLFTSVSNRSNNQIKLPTINSQIEKFQKIDKLMDVLFMDIDRYHKSLLDYMKKSASSSNLVSMGNNNRNINSMRIQMNGKISRTSHIKGVIERLDFLKFVLLKSTITLTEEQMMILWNAFGEGAVTIETFDKFMVWFDSLIGKSNKVYCHLLKLLSLDNDFMNPLQPSKLSVILIDNNEPVTNITNNNDENELINNVIFEDDIIIKLFNSKIISFITKRENIEVISRMSIGTLIIKYFLLVNVLNKSIRVDMDTDSWNRVGPLSGLTILWRMGMDCLDVRLSDAAINLIVELHQSMPSKFRYSNSIRSYLMKLCFIQLSTCVQSLRIEDTVNSSNDTTSITNTSNARTISNEENVINQAIATSRTIGEGFVNVPTTSATPIIRPLRLPETPPIAIMAGCDDWFDDGDSLLDHQVFTNRINKLINLMRLFIYRFTYFPTQFLNIKILAGREDTVVLSLRMLSTDTIGTLRQKIANHFKEPCHLITLIKDKSKTVNNSSIGTIFANSVERYDRDDITLKNAKIGHNDCVIARKKDVSNANDNPNSGPISNANTANPNSSSQHGENVVDVINPIDLNSNILEVLDPLSWLGNIKPNNSNQIFSEPIFPTNRIVSEHKLTGNQSNILTLFNECDSAVVISNNVDSVDYLGQYLRKSPHHIDQLLEMLDGYLSAEIKNISSTSNTNSMDLPTAIWDVIQSLPTHVILLQQIKNIPNDKTSSVRILLDLACPYRMLYTLQIFDKILTNLRIKNNSIVYSNIYEWSTKLLYLGTSEHIVSLLISLLDKKEYKNNDINVLTITILIRILHHFLLYDPDYSMYQVSIQVIKISYNIPPNSIINNQSVVPPGIVLSYLNINKLIYDLLDYFYNTIMNYDGNISISSIETLLDHILTLIFCLLLSLDNAWEILLEYPLGLLQWLYNVCLNNYYDSIKSISCKKIFEFCCNLFYLSIDTSISTLNSTTSMYVNLDIPLTIDQKTKRYQLLENFYILISNVITEYQHNQKINKFNCNYIFSLLALLYSLRFSPNIIFPNDLLFQINTIDNYNILFSYLSSTDNDNNNVIESNKFISISNNLLKLLINILLNYNSLEIFHSNKSDGTLIGILRILLIFSKKFHLFDLSNWNNNFYNFLYKNCLFPNSLLYNSLCQTWESRNLIYAILYQLCIIDNNNLYNISLSILYNNKIDSKNDNSSNIITKSRSKSIQFHYDPNLLARDVEAYVGLYNQGGTCYMNSFLQQLYHIPSFSNAILSIDIPNINIDIDKDTNIHNDDEFLDNSTNDNTSYTIQNDMLLFQLQVLFGYLKLSQKKSYNTLPFCKSFYDYDNKPVSLVEQKDINEFASMLFDKLENTTVNNKCKSIFNNTFQGSVVYHTKSLESSYRSEKVENFYMITCEVKGKSTLEESLELLVNEEQFSGENKIEDPLLNRKVDATRRCTIRDLPNTLIIHLKRFEFDLETLDRKKVNDYIKFPMDLDMYPYTEEGINAKEKQMKQSYSDSHLNNLSSSSNDLQDNRKIENILESEDAIEYDNEIDIDDENKDDIDDKNQQHHKAGSKDHERNYYKYNLVGIVAHVGAIDRGHYYSFIKDRNSDKWYEFNDRNVYPFSADAIPNECFGGEEQIQLGNGTITKKMKQNNAYLLFYEKVSNSDIELEIDNTKENKSNEKNVKDVTTTMSKQVVDTIWYENTEFQTDRYIYHISHYRFIYQLLLTIPTNDISIIPINTLKNIILIGLKFTIEVVSTGRSTSCIPIFFDKINDIIISDNTNECCYEIINELSYNNINQIAKHYSDHSIYRKNIANYPINLKKSFEDKEYLYNHIHPWIVVTFISCPHNYTIRAFSKLIVTCIKNIRANECQKYLHINDKIDDTIDSNVNEKKVDTTDSTIVNKMDSNDIAIDNNIIEESNPIHSKEYLDRHSSPVSRLLNNIIVVIEKIPLDCIHGRDGFHMLGGILYHVSSFGYEEKQLLLHLQSIYRLVCAILHLNPSQNKIPTDDLIYFIDLISLLIRSSAFTKSNSLVETSYQLAMKSPYLLPEALTVLNQTGSIHILEAHDAQAFLNRVFLNDSIIISPNKISSAITHLCVSRGGKEVNRVCEFLMEKLEESLLSNRGANMIIYRSYFKIISDLVITAESVIVYDLLIPGIINKADAISNRYGQYDAEFLYVVYKLLLRIGLNSTIGFTYVKRYKEYWKRLRVKFLSIKRKGGPYYSNNDMSNDPMTSSNNNNNTNNNNSTISNNINNKDEDFSPYTGFILGL